jgi:hypothetical protein
VLAEARPTDANGRLLQADAAEAARASKGMIMVKRSLIGVVLLPSLVVGALVTAPPAAASVTACADPINAVDNGSGRLEVQACVRHTAGHYYSWGVYWCFKPSAHGLPNPNTQLCNVGATQDLWYNATRVRSDDVGGINDSVFLLSGSPAGCTTAWIHSSIHSIRVRFLRDGYLWSSPSTTRSANVAGSRSC